LTRDRPEKRENKSLRYCLDFYFNIKERKRRESIGQGKDRKKGAMKRKGLGRKRKGKEEGSDEKEKVRWIEQHG
jgi:hypothetical protein